MYAELSNFIKVICQASGCAERRRLAGRRCPLAHLTQSLTPPLSYSHSHTVTHTSSFTHSLSDTHTYFHSLSVMHTSSFTHSLSLTQTFTPSHSLRSLTPSVSLSFTLTVVHTSVLSPLSLTHSFTYLLTLTSFCTHILFYLLTHSLPHLPALSLLHPLLSHSLTC